MRLSALNPRWFAEAGRHGQGVTFDCPCCLGKPNAVRLAAAFAPPLDGGAPISLTPAALLPTLWPKPEDRPGLTTVPPGIHWQRKGDTFETLTLSPSVDASGSGHWHGWLTGGELS